jgi:hypothetical protein
VGRLVCRRGAIGSLLLLGCLRRFRRSDQLTRPRDGLGLGAAGEQTVVPGVSDNIRERSSSMKNRKRESCTSGSVRDEGGNILKMALFMLWF